MNSNRGDEDTDARFVAVDGVLVTEVDDELVLLDEESETYYGVNAVGAFLWEQLAEPQTVEDLEAATAAEFDTSAAECREDVRSFVDELRAAGLVDEG